MKKTPSFSSRRFFSRWHCLWFCLPFCLALFQVSTPFFTSDSIQERALFAQDFSGKDVLQNQQTCGGMFLWQDVHFFQEWHIQRSIVTGKFRLLDPRAVCRASGSREFCENVLEEYRKELNLPPMSGRVLILLHGFASNSVLLENMAIWFRKNGDYSAVLNISYPSSFVTVAEEAKYIAEIVAALEGVEKIDFVGHSLGSIILRHYLGNYAALNADGAGEPPLLPDARIGRFVQLCPPNQGADVAAAHNAGPVGLLFPVLSELALPGPELKKRFGIPNCEFGIIAGFCPGFEYYGEETDRVLNISTTKLDGAKEWKKIQGEHSKIPNKIETFENVRDFLNTGKF